jgi:hypothetical protein
MHITLATDGGEGSASRLGCYTSGERAAGTNWTEGLLLNPRAILDLGDTCSYGQEIGPINGPFRPRDFFRLIVALKSGTVVWVVTACSSEEVWRFGRTYDLHLQGRRSNKPALRPASACFLLGLIFDSEDGDKLLQHFGLSPNYTALRFRKPFPS